MSKPPLRPLLPLQTSQGLPETTSQSSSKKRKPPLKAGGACNVCHKRKTACNGDRPRCEYCTKRNLDCVYETDIHETPNKALRREVQQLRQQQEYLTNLVERLRDGPRIEVDVILNRLRASAEPLVVAKSYVSGAISDHRPSLPPATWMKETGFSSATDVSLTARYGMIYPAPNKTSDGNLIDLLLFNKAIALPTEDSSPRVSSATLASSTEPTSLRDTEYYLRGLQGLQIDFWTSVPISNQFAIRVISSFLETQHPFFGLFDPAKFVDSLSRKQSEVGLSLLVNAILASGCVSSTLLCAHELCGGFTYTELQQTLALEAADALSLSFDFEKEAERLWLAERLSPSANSIAGLVMLLISANMHDHWKVSEKYRQDIFQMAKRWKLYDSASGPSDEELNKMPQEQRDALPYLAWGVYNYTIMQSIFYITDPPEFPPTVLLVSDMEPAMNSTFRAWCTFWVIVNRILLVYHSTTDQMPPPLAFALSQFSAILTFADQLPSMIGAEESKTVAAYCLRIWIHIIIIDLFRPFVVNREIFGSPELFDDEKLSFPDAISAASIRQLKQLVLEYQVYYEKDATVTYWHVACIYLVNYLVKDTQDVDRNLYLMLCMRAYQRFKRTFLVGHRLQQGLLLMAIELKVLSPAQVKDMIAAAERLLGPISSVGNQTDYDGDVQNRDSSSDRPTNIFLVDLDKGQHERTSSRLDVMAEKFKNVQLFDEFTSDVV